MFKRDYQILKIVFGCLLIFFISSGCYIIPEIKKPYGENEDKTIAGGTPPSVPGVNESALNPKRFVYVNCNHPNAKDDPANGTESNPYKTIQYAADRAEPGDHIIVNRGIYNERVKIKRSGNANHYIVFKGENKPVCNGFELISNYIAVIGFDIFEPDTNHVGYWHGGGFWLEGSYLFIANNYITNFLNSAGVMCHANTKSSYVHISNNYIHLCNKGMSISGKYYLVEDNKIERLVLGSQSNDCDYFRFFGENLIFRRNIMFGTKEEEIGKSHVDLFQTFDNNNCYARNVLIEENIGCDFYHQALMLSGTYESHRNIIFRRNVFANGRAWGFCCHGGNGLHIINNTIYNIGIHGCGFSKKGEYNTRGVIKNNIFAYCTASYWAEDKTNVIWETGFNLIYKCKNSPNPSNKTDIIGADPLFLYNGNPTNITLNDILGPDGKPFTSDDGLNVSFNSPARGNGENGVNIGAY